MVTSIREFKENDIAYKVKWINDEDNNQYLHYELPLEVEKTTIWFKSLKERNDRVDYTILYNNHPVGLIGLLNIDDQKKEAEYYICLGERGFKGKGIASQATKILIEQARRLFNISRIYLYTEVNNIKAQSLFERTGFVKKQILRNHIYYNGRNIDRYLYSLDLLSN
ncbi:GNAT family N-acetyltransferase [Priestia megaterium]|uniref:GNAT family N-acetyltransferase n=1 Tax=Priestia megaterium TaxID=1404 RepID=UPI00177B670C|nr:GNAT family protein [Priestia megaterium]MBD8110038.1 GNAT family N-acetyltransferase [Priestia megaterium]